MNETRWGIIGPGKIAKDFVNDLSVIKNHTHVVSSVLGRTENSTVSFKKEHGIKSHYLDLNEFIKSGDIDCVYVATPHPLHYEECKALLEAGIPVLCEKPLAINKKQVDELISISQRTNTFLMEAMWIRFLPSIQYVVEKIKEGVVGDINSIVAALSYRAPYDTENRYFNQDLGGGSLLDIGIYPVYLSYYLLGIPASIKATGKISSTGVDEATSVLFGYPNGAYCVLESSFIKTAPLEASIYGSKGTIHIGSPWNEKPHEITITTYEGSSWSYKPEWKARGLHFEVEEVVKCLKESKIQSDGFSHKSSAELMGILDQIRNQINVKYTKYE